MGEVNVNEEYTIIAKATTLEQLLKQLSDFKEHYEQNKEVYWNREYTITLLDDECVAKIKLK